MLYDNSEGLPASKSFHDDHAFSNVAFASSGRCCDMRTEARVCNASLFSGSVCSAKFKRSSQVFSAAGSKLGHDEYFGRSILF